MQLETSVFHCICEQISRRLERAADRNILGFGFGAALRDGWVDSGRPFVVRFYVRQKRTRNIKYQVPRRLSLKTAPEPKGRKVPRISLPTDVFELPEVVATSRKTQPESGEPATTGAVLRWQENDRELPSWGLLTVSHALPRDYSGKIEIQGNLSTGIWIQSDPENQLGVDAALLPVRFDQLVDAGLLPSGSSAMHVVPWEEINHFGTVAGRTKQPQRRQDFLSLGTIARLSIQGVGTSVRNLVHVQAALDAFPPGSSGGIFRVTGSSHNPDCLVPAAMQLASNSNGFTDGFGQSLEYSVNWIRGQIALKLFREGRFLLDDRLDLVHVF